MEATYNISKALQLPNNISRISLKLLDLENVVVIKYIHFTVYIPLTIFLNNIQGVRILIKNCHLLWMFLYIDKILYPQFLANLLFLNNPNTYILPVPCSNEQYKSYKKGGRNVPILFLLLNSVFLNCS